MRRSSFTIIEIVFVMSIIVMLAVLVLPGFLRHRANACQNVALMNLKTLYKSLLMYYATNKVYPSELSELGIPNSTPPYADSSLISGTKSNYNFIYAPVYTEEEITGFTINANPDAFMQSLGAKFFFIDETGVARAKAGAPAGADDEIFGR